MAKRKAAGKLSAKLKAKSDQAATGQGDLLKQIESLQETIAAGPMGVERDRQIGKLNATLREYKAKNQALMKALQEAEARSDHLLEIQDEPTRRTWERLQKKPSKGSTAIVGLMDWHVEERVDGHTIDHLNHFDLKVAEKRVKRTFEKAIYLLDFARGIAKIDELVLAVLGDLITGYIHEELVENNYLSPTEACLFVQDMLCSGIDHLLKHSGVKSILIPTCHGNHGRTGVHKLVSTGYKNSFEWQLYHQMARLYRNEPRVKFKIEDGIHNWVMIQGKAVRFHHGDHIRYQGGVGGITIPVNKKIAAWNKARVADLDVFGHWHQFLDTWKWVCGGCLIGYNAYAQSIGADFQEPTQLFSVIDRVYSKVLAVPIFCEEGSALQRAAAA